jgi:hypothetical protein
MANTLATAADLFLSGSDEMARLTRALDWSMLFISGHTGDEAVLQRLVPAGAPFLHKPFRPEALAETVAGLLRSRQTA